MLHEADSQNATPSFDPLRLWAKHGNSEGSFYPLLAHLLDTATAAAALWQIWLRPGLRELIANQLVAADVTPGTDRVTKPDTASAQAALKDEGLALKAVQLICALHDIGKANPVFQGQLAAPKERVKWAREFLESLGADAKQWSGPIANTAKRTANARRHERVGALYLATEEYDYLNLPTEGNWLPLICQGHHGAWQMDLNIRKTSRLRNGEWVGARDALVKQVEDALQMRVADLPAKVSPTAILLLSGLAIVADRLASGDDWVEFQQSRLSRGELSLERAEDWVDASFPQMCERVENVLGTFHPFDNPHEAILGEFSPRPAQAAALSTKRGLCTIMAPTGSGKTEAALLRHSNEPAERLIFLLPTQTTSNAMMRRMERVFAGQHMFAALAHSMAQLDEFYTNLEGKGTVVTDDEAATSRNTLKSTAADSGDQCEQGLLPSEFVRRGSARLLAPICVGTIDQGLMGALPLKWISLRLLALANAHVVIDEVHSLDSYQTELLVPLLRWWAATDTRVTLLSATQPQAQFTQILENYAGLRADAPGVRDCVFPSVSAAQPDAQQIARKRFGDFDFATMGSPTAPTESAAVVEAHTQLQVTPLEIQPSHFTYSLAEATPASARAALAKQGVEQQKPLAAFPTANPYKPQAAIDTHFAWALEQMRRYPHARLGVFVNRVQSAQEIGMRLREYYAAQLDDDLPQPKILVLHSRMTARHRREVEAEIIKALGPGSTTERIIVVGTQTIESSIDADLDMISTDLAPAPALIQRAGRGWRRTDPQRCERLTDRQGNVADFDALPLQIVYSQLDRFALPYPEAVMAHTLDWLVNNPENQVQAPGDIQEFVDASWVDLATITTSAAEQAHDLGNNSTVTAEGVTEDIEDEAASARAAAEMMEAVAKMQAAQTAIGRRVDLSSLYDPEATLNSYHALADTSAATVGDDEPTTRLITQETRTLLLVPEATQNTSATGHEPGEVDADSADCSPLLPWDPKVIVPRGMEAQTLRQILDNSVPVSAKAIMGWTNNEASGARLLTSNDAPGMLQGKWVVPIKQRLHYDPLVGLLLLPEDDE